MSSAQTALSDSGVLGAAVPVLTELSTCGSVAFADAPGVAAPAPLTSNSALPFSGISTGPRTGDSLTRSYRRLRAAAKQHVTNEDAEEDAPRVGGAEVALLLDFDVGDAFPLHNRTSQSLATFSLSGIGSPVGEGSEAAQEVQDASRHGDILCLFAVTLRHSAAQIGGAKPELATSHAGIQTRSGVRLNASSFHLNSRGASKGPGLARLRPSVPLLRSVRTP
ncbi:hypothetical protein DPEC_G00309820 [Dallia pectoralis]|uniref:Uncharacterized protein n=1 Tax=Dallia pectoralis TaxID=75939 RepID=A0ACC2FF23_DALPE|nr:hypothetical protein DPEC_G00309820 [Dallia pectoralis]